jgi:hypothetical protein
VNILTVFLGALFMRSEYRKHIILRSCLLPSACFIIRTAEVISVKFYVLDLNQKVERICIVDLMSL